MDLMDELQRLEHQLGLATRMLAMVRDRPAATRLAALGDDIKARIDGLKAVCLKDAIRRRAYHLWEESGRPGDTTRTSGWRPNGKSKTCPSVTRSLHLYNAVRPRCF
jgi:hypothetical protein